MADHKCVRHGLPITDDGCPECSRIVDEAIASAPRRRTIPVGPAATAEIVIAGWKQAHDRAVEERIEAMEESARLRKHLQWIADQPCERAPGHVSFRACAESGDCLTEWCLPCYARAALEDSDG